MRVGIIGPLPPPAGGMANQTRQLAALLRRDGVKVQLVRTNEPYRPAWITRYRGIRAIFRLAPYLRDIANACRESDIVHVMANSGWAWHLCAAPAIAISAARGIPVVVNYRGGLAREFLAKSGRLVRSTARLANSIVVPSRFLQEIFAEHNIPARIIPNIVDLDTFQPIAAGRSDRIHVVILRNLEYIYGIDIAIRAAAILRKEFPTLLVTIAGAGPERPDLERLTEQLGLTAAIRFTGSLDVAAVASLYREANVVLNPSRADNTPNSLLEAAASGVPIVSTDVGGVPYLVEHRRTAWLVSSEDPEAMAAGLSAVLRNPELQATLRDNGLALARSCSWGAVGTQWLDLYRQLINSRNSRRRKRVLREP